LNPVILFLIFFIEKKNHGIQLQHELKQREKWVQNYVSISSPENRGSIDVYEYFWDVYMVHEISVAEAFKLVIKASKGAERFYKDHPEYLDEAMDLSIYSRKRKMGFGQKEFPPGGYLKLLGPSFVALSKILPYVPFGYKLLEVWSSTQIPILSHVFKAINVLVEKAAKDFLGDLVRYLDLDPRSKHFETRQKVINGALEELIELMKSDYEQIIVAGHSLGSVIAYDALNRIIQQVNVGKIKEKEASKIIGLVTFGSPLDKIALFFRERVKRDKEVQRQILANLHGFKTRSLVEEEWDIDIGNPMDFVLSDTRWLNFYHDKDLVSGRLDLYDLKSQPPHSLKSRRKDGNISIVKEFSRTRAHSCYWGEHMGTDKGTNQMYEDIIKEFFS